MLSIRMKVTVGHKKVCDWPNQSTSHGLETSYHLVCIIKFPDFEVQIRYTKVLGGAL